MGSHDCQDTLLIDLQLQIPPDPCSHMPIADGIAGFLLDGADVFDDCNQIGIPRITTRTVVVVAFPGYVGNGA